jgi:serine/threonine-protein phosphatase 2A regulatory subunit A
LAVVLGNMLDNAGGPQYADHVIRVLEQLCYIEEPIVRQKATESIKTILSKIRIIDFEQPLLEILTKLITNECTDPKKAAINLIPTVYLSVNQPI